MYAPLPRYPAVLLVREPGEIIFANPAALEQTVWLSGMQPGEGWTLPDLVNRIYAEGSQPRRAARMLDRALSAARRRGALRCRVIVPVPELGPTPWDVHISHLAGHAKTTYEVSFRRAQTSEERPRHRATGDRHLLNTALHQAVRILDRAILGAEPLEPEIAGATRDLLQRAQDLLGRLEGTVGGAVPPDPSP